jgi:hypothetical protein
MPAGVCDDSREFALDVVQGGLIVSSIGTNKNIQVLSEL